MMTRTRRIRKAPPRQVIACEALAAAHAPGVFRTEVSTMIFEVFTTYERIGGGGLYFEDSV